MENNYFGSLNKFKSIVAAEFFVNPADQNYILSRWMLVNRFYPEVFWQYSQAIEKYSKAILITNGHSAAKYKHDIVRIFKDVRAIAGGLLPDNFVKPNLPDDTPWKDQSLDDFVKQISLIGNPDARYSQLKWKRPENSLQKLDQLIFLLRRLTIGLSWVIGEDFTIEDECAHLVGRTYRSALNQDSWFQPRGEMDTLKDSIFSFGETKADLLHSWNYAFTRSDDDANKYTPYTVNPTIGALDIGLIYVVDGAFKNEMCSSEMVEWLVNNVKFSDIPEDLKKFLPKK